MQKCQEAHVKLSENPSKRKAHKLLQGVEEENIYVVHGGDCF